MVGSKPVVVVAKFPVMGETPAFVDEGTGSAPKWDRR
jgi:hypothetical protein